MLDKETFEAENAVRNARNTHHGHEELLVFIVTTPQQLLFNSVGSQQGVAEKDVAQSNAQDHATRDEAADFVGRVADRFHHDSYLSLSDPALCCVVYYVSRASTSGTKGKT